MFSTELLDSQQARYTIVAEVILVFLAFFYSANVLRKEPEGYEGRNQNLTPSPRTMIPWALMMVLMIMSLLIAMFNFDTVPLAVVGSFAFVALLFVLGWVRQYAQNPEKSSVYLVVATLFAVVMVFACSSTPQSTSLDLYAPFATACMSGPIALWLAFAALFNYMEANAA